jgi:hypothetical protein
MSDDSEMYRVATLEDENVSLRAEMDELRTQLAEAREAIRDVICDEDYGPRAAFVGPLFMSEQLWNAKLARLRRAMEG